VRAPRRIGHRAFAALAVAALLATGCSSSRKSSVEAASAEKPGKPGPGPAPALALPDDAGRTVSLADYKGKVVLLDFWATWCGPCKIEIPWFIEFQRKYKDQGFSVIGVAMDEDGWEIIRPFAEQYKMNYPILLGNDETASAFGGVEVLPTTFIIDRQGRIVATHMGLVSKSEFEDAIKALL
jgi:cytochrome c biogenesis protein CcmG/thiol:disulfide interchange protein DsbE